MKKEHSIMSIGTQSFLGSVVVGMIWIVVGIIRLFDNPILDIIHFVLLVSAFSLMVFIMKANREEDDEMSSYNFTKAKAKTCDFMHLVCCGIAIIALLLFALFEDYIVSWPRIVVSIIFLLIGIQDVITGIVFHTLEAE